MKIKNLNKSHEGFILITVIIFILILSLLVERAYYGLHIEQRLFYAFQRRNELLDLVQKGVLVIKADKISCSKQLCISKHIEGFQTVYMIKAVKDDMSMTVRIIYTNGRCISYEQIQNENHNH